MTTSIFILLVLLQIKHWYIDFVNQSTNEVASKGIYGDSDGVNHSLKQGIGTMIAIVLAVGTPYIAYAAVLGFLDFVLHYHIDWTKMNYGNRDISTPAFWNHLGLDQMAHQLTYLFIAWAMII
jgi:hypothetical protein